MDKKNIKLQEIIDERLLEATNRVLHNKNLDGNFENILLDFLYIDLIINDIEINKRANALNKNDKKILNLYKNKLLKLQEEIIEGEYKNNVEINFLTFIEFLINFGKINEENKLTTDMFLAIVFDLKFLPIFTKLNLSNEEIKNIYCILTSILVDDIEKLYTPQYLNASDVFKNKLIIDMNSYQNEQIENNGEIQIIKALEEQEVLYENFSYKYIYEKADKEIDIKSEEIEKIYNYLESEYIKSLFLISKEDVTALKEIYMVKAIASYGMTSNKQCNMYTIDMKNLIGTAAMLKMDPSHVYISIVNNIAITTSEEYCKNIIFLQNLKDVIKSDNVDIIASLLITIKAIAEKKSGNFFFISLINEKDYDKFINSYKILIQCNPINIDAYIEKNYLNIIKDFTAFNQSYLGFKVEKDFYKHINEKKLKLKDFYFLLDRFLTDIKNEKIKDNILSVKLLEEIAKKENYLILQKNTTTKDLEAKLNNKIFGQKEATKQLTHSMKFKEAGLMSEENPVMSFLFIGPTGTGKTESVKELAKQMDMNLERFDMSEYSDPFTVSKLIGAPNGYVGYDEGGILCNAIKKNPKSVVLFDEIEKADNSIFNVLLQILDYGIITDNKGNKVSFKDTVIVLTSNAGINMMGKKTIGFNKEDSSRSLIENEVKNIFPPEFINRISKIVYFEPLDFEIAKSIAKKELNTLKDLVKKRNIILEYTEEAIENVAKKGYSQEYGAREIKRVIEQEIKPLMVDEILYGKLKNGGKCKVDYNENNFIFLIV